MACEDLQLNLDLIEELEEVSSDTYESIMDEYNSELADAYDVCLWWFHLDAEVVNELFGMSPAELEALANTDNNFDATDVCSIEIAEALSLREDSVEALAFSFAVSRTRMDVQQQLKECMHQQNG